MSGIAIGGRSVTALFGLINVIAATMITQPREIGKLYDALPPDKKDGIDRRDAKP